VEIYSSMGLANKITFLRIICIPVFILIFLSNLPYRALISTGVFILLALTDGLDGYIARKRHEITRLGIFLDPLADKLLVSAALIFLIGYGVEAWMVFLIIAREFAIMGLRISASIYKVDIKASILGKLKTLSQIIGIVLVLIKFPYAWWFMLLAVIMTLLSGVQYLYNFRKFLA